MASIRDRTEDFKDAVRREAVVLGYNEAKMAAIMASFIIHKPRERTQFMKTTLKTLELIGELYEFLKKHRDAYVNRGRTTEEERDSVEQEVSIFVKSCQEQINFLKASINDEEATLKGWTGIRTGSSNVDTIAHKHGVVLILSEKLHYVTSAFDELRAIRFQDTLDRSMRRKIPDSKPIDHVESRNSEVEEPDEVGSRPQVVQQQFEDDETSALQVELRELLDAAHDTETRMVEVSALGQLMSTHVLHQVHQIEHLYEQAVEATQNVELGNKELSQAIQRNSSSRTFLLLFLFVLTFSVLFLDWYS